MEIVTKQRIISEKILNKDTGQLEDIIFTEQHKSKKIRGGFNLMYHKSYEEVTEQVIKSNKDVRLFNWITNQFTYARIEVPLVYSQCDIEVSQPQFSRMIKQLLELNYIKRISRGIYRLNPFVYVPFRANAEELQHEWDELSKQ